ncbi:MAG: EpsI family protein [Nitrospirae bacterium]|nr:EpsI family protein [Nitrospirota bacterium]
MRKKKYIVIAVLLGLTHLFVSQMPYAPPVALKKDIGFFPLNIGAWKGQDIKIDTDNLPPFADQYIYRKYLNDKGETLFLYIGYWGKFRHNANVFSGNNIDPGYLWEPENEKQVPIDVAGGRISVNETVYKNGSDGVSLVYWYQTGKGATADRFRERVLNGLGAVINLRTNAALIKISSSPLNGSDIDSAGIRSITFAEEIYPFLREFLPFDM